MEETNGLDIFNLNIDDFKQKEKASTGSTLYKTDPKEGKDGIYRSIVRFLPNPKNPKKSAIKKFTYWLTDSEGNGGYFDSPKSISWDEKCTIADLYFKLSKSNSAADQKAAEQLSRKEYYFALVYIVKDNQNSDLEGTVQVYRFPKTLKKVIDSQTSPSQEDIDMGQEPCNIFDLFNGKNFNIKVTTKGGYWNYDECKFADSKSPLKLGDTLIERTEEDMKSVMDMMNKAPDLSIYEYRPLKDEKISQLNKILNEIDPSGNAVAQTTIAESAVKSTTASTTIETVTENSNTIEEMNSNSAQTSDDDLDSFLEGLG